MTRATRDGATTTRDASEGRLSAMFLDDYYTNPLDHWRDETLATVTPDRARYGAAMLRSIAFARWCGACQDGDHFNHAVRVNSKVRGPRPKRGACWSVNLGRWLCACPWREKEASQ